MDEIIPMRKTGKTSYMTQRIKFTREGRYLDALIKLIMARQDGLAARMEFLERALTGWRLRR